MANTSYNQVRQLYVVENGIYNASTNNKEATFVEAKKTLENELFFTYKGADGVLKSDLINLGKIDKVEKFSATDLATKMRKVSIKLAANPIAGQDYILGINFKNFFSSGDASQYYKDAVVHATSAMDTKKKLLDAMKAALDLAFSREDGATANSNPYLAFSVDNTDSSNPKLVIEEKEQEWIQGTMPQRRIYFDVFPKEIWVNQDEVNWAAVNATTREYYTEETPSTTVGNGKAIADLEWCCLGERGDQYRYMGYPNYVQTKYYVDPSAQYDVLEIHYAFTDTGVNSYRTEKELTIVAPYNASGASTVAKHQKLYDVIAALNTAAGSTLVTNWSNG